MMKKLLKFLKDEEGIEIVEWGLMCVVFAVSMIAVFPSLVAAMEAFYGLLSVKLQGMSV